MNFIEYFIFAAAIIFVPLSLWIFFDKRRQAKRRARNWRRIRKMEEKLKEREKVNGMRAWRKIRKKEFKKSQKPPEI